MSPPSDRFEATGTVAPVNLLHDEIQRFGDKESSMSFLVF
jgi:hypothetical protein